MNDGLHPAVYSCFQCLLGLRGCILQLYRGQHRKFRFVFDAIRQECLKLKFRNCDLSNPLFKLLAHRIDNNREHFDEEKCKAINEAPVTTKMTALHELLGITEYYSRFIKEFAGISTSSHALTYGNWNFEWSEEMNMSFETLKERFTSRRVLAFTEFQPPLLWRKALQISPLEPFSLYKKENSNIHPVQFKINTKERNFSPAKVNLSPSSLLLERFEFISNKRRW